MCVQTDLPCPSYKRVYEYTYMCMCTCVLCVHMHVYICIYVNILLAAKKQRSVLSSETPPSSQLIESEIH